MMGDEISVVAHNLPRLLDGLNADIMWKRRAAHAKRP